MTPSSRFHHEKDHQHVPLHEELRVPSFDDPVDNDDDILTEALEITPSSSPTNTGSSCQLFVTRDEPNGKAWEVVTETEPMLPHPHLQLSLIRSSCKSTKSTSSPTSSMEAPESPLSMHHVIEVDLAKPDHNHHHPKDDDEESVGYFEVDDFNSSYWRKAISSVPTLSLAAILTTGFAIMHPWMFVLGALTAVGTAHAYGWIPTSSSSSSSSSESSSPSTPEQAEHGVEETTGTTTTTTHTLPPTELFCRSFSPGNMTNDLAIPTDQWLRKYFPPLDYEVISNQEFPGLSAAEFVQVFFADDAPYSFMEFQKKRGDVDICYSPWSETATASGPPQALSLVSQAALLDDDDLPSVESVQQRVLTFKTMTKSLFGPPFAIATKKQVAVRRSKRCVVIESMTTLAQIPFCDRFYIVERWLIQSEKQGTPSRHVAKLQVHAQVFFTTKCPFEYQIRTKSAATLTEVCKGWCAMAQEALKLTEQAKLERLQRQEQDNLSCCTTVSSYGKDDDPLYSYSPKGDDYESSIEVPYSPVYYHDDRYPDDSSSSSSHKRLSLGLASPRLFLTRCKRNLWIRRRSSTNPL